MIEVTINQSAGYIGIRGHAGYADKGQDIVCAGMSALLFAFAEAMNRAGGLYSLHTAEGRSDLHYRPSRAAGRRLQVFEAGVDMLELQYPENVRVIEGEKKHNADDRMIERRENNGADHDDGIVGR